MALKSDQQRPTSHFSKPGGSGSPSRPFPTQREEIRAIHVPPETSLDPKRSNARAAGGITHLQPPKASLRVPTQTRAPSPLSGRRKRRPRHPPSRRPTARVPRRDPPVANGLPSPWVMACTSPTGLKFPQNVSMNTSEAKDVPPTGRTAPFSPSIEVEREPQACSWVCRRLGRPGMLAAVLGNPIPLCLTPALSLESTLPVWFFLIFLKGKTPCKY